MSVPHLRERRAGGLRDERRAGRRCSRNTSRSRTCRRRGPSPAHAVEMESDRRASRRKRGRALDRCVKKPFFDPAERKARMKHANATTPSSSAAGTTGSSARPISRAPGKKVLVLERRDRIGGAAYSEEVFPGFKFSVFSYVVSLLRPEIIRDLELPRHGLQILPLESTLTPLANGDYLAQWGGSRPEPRASSRAIRRATRRRTTSSAGCMHHMARGREADPRDGAARSRVARSERAPRPAARSAGTSAGCGAERLPCAVQADHHERGRLSRRVVRDRSR